MRCKYCGKKINDKATFCQHCGKEVRTEVVHDVRSTESSKKTKKKKQIFRTLIIILLTIIAIGSGIITYFYTDWTVDGMIKFFFSTPELKVLMVFTLCIPIAYGAIILALGWLAIVLINAACVVLCLLTMIKATKGRKIFLSILIIAFIVIAIIAGVKGNNLDTSLSMFF